jgi:HAD superfamily hydrolase (TIGR01509 family)
MLSRVDKLDVCILGDDVSEKKPSPLIYNEAAKRIGIPNDRCVVIEDSLIGLKAAKGAVSSFAKKSA